VGFWHHVSRDSYITAESNGIACIRETDFTFAKVKDTVFEYVGSNKEGKA
jgi:hypothetical protein